MNVSITDTFNQLMILPLFVSNQKLTTYFYDNDLKILFNKSFECAYSKELTKNQVIQNNENWLYELETYSFPIKNCVNNSNIAPLLVSINVRLEKINKIIK